MGRKTGSIVRGYGMDLGSGDLHELPDAMVSRSMGEGGEVKSGMERMARWW